MKKYFNNAGPSVAGQHYMIDPLVRIDIDEIEVLIRQQRYFVLHAPRQTGKTTALLALMAHLNAKDDCRAVYANIEGAQAVRHDMPAGVAAMCSAISRSTALYLQDDWMETWLTGPGRDAVAPADRIAGMLAGFCQHSDRPVVLLLDEVDALVGDTLDFVVKADTFGVCAAPGGISANGDSVVCGMFGITGFIRVTTKSSLAVRRSISRVCRYELAISVGRDGGLVAAT